MDCNQDGDLPRREFLGTREQFVQSDADSDSLISADEAEAIATNERKSLRTKPLPDRPGSPLVFSQFEQVVEKLRILLPA